MISTRVEIVEVVRPGYDCDGCGTFLPCHGDDISKDNKDGVHAFPRYALSIDGVNIDVKRRVSEGDQTEVRWHLCKRCWGLVNEAIKHVFGDVKGEGPEDEE